MKELRKRFIEETSIYSDGTEMLHKMPTHLIVAVKLPTGAVEIITNTQQLETKVTYYLNAYDDNFCLKNNPAIQIVGFMLV